MRNNCTLFFVNLPKKGTVKKELAKVIGDNKVVDLYKKFVDDMLTEVKKIKYDLVFYVHPSYALNNFKKWLGADKVYFMQKGAGMGERMKNAFYEQITRGYKKMILIGSDIPDLSSNLIKKAFAELNNNDVVIGPAEDGGYYLIGFNNNTFLPDLFDNISWSTEKVYDQTVRKIKNAKYSVSVLDKIGDIDNFEALKDFYYRNKSKKLKTVEYIDEILDL